MVDKQKTKQMITKNNIVEFYRVERLTAEDEIYILSLLKHFPDEDSTDD